MSRREQSVFVLKKTNVVTCVRLDVRGAVLLARERSLTERALERAISGMDAQVHGEVALARELLRAARKETHGRKQTPKPMNERAVREEPRKREQRPERHQAT